MMVGNIKIRANHHRLSTRKHQEVLFAREENRVRFRIKQVELARQLDYVQPHKLEKEIHILIDTIFDLFPFAPVARHERRGQVCHQLVRLRLINEFDNGMFTADHLETATKLASQALYECYEPAQTA